MGDISMPPMYFDQPFIMYYVNSDMIPNFYNGTRGLGENGLASSKITLNVLDIKDIKDNKIKIRAVTCRAGWKDSKAAEITFRVIDQEKPQDGIYVFRPNEFGMNNNLPPSSDPCKDIYNPGAAGIANSSKSF